MHPTIAEICRVKGEVKLTALRRWQHDLRTSIQPQLDELERIKNHEQAPERRGPGRPRKVQLAEAL